MSYCHGHCSQLSGYLNFAHNGLQQPTARQRNICGRLSGTKSKVFDVLSNRYEYELWMWQISLST